MKNLFVAFSFLGFGMWIRLIILCSSILFEGMSLSGINIQLGAIEQDLHAGSGELQWIATAFLIAYASFLLMGGRCADYFGARRIFISGIALFGIGAFLAGSAFNVQWLIIARALQGAGAALTTPASIVLIASEFSLGPERNRALVCFSAMGALGFALGVLLIGALTEWWGWRAGYYFFVIPSLFVLILAQFTIRKVKINSSNAIPWLQAFMSVFALTAVLYGIELVGEGHYQLAILILFMGSLTVILICGAGIHSENALVPVELIGRPDLILPVFILASAFSGITGAMFLVSTLLPLRGYSPLDIGLILLPQGLAVAVCSPIATCLMNWGTPLKIAFGSLLLILVGLLLYTISAQYNYSDYLFFGTLFVGAGIALLYPTATVMVSMSASMNEQGIAFALLTTGQQIGSALGIAIVVAVNNMIPYQTLVSFSACIILVVCALIFYRIVWRHMNSIKIVG